ncbi:hypothetical protein CVT24_002541 [Panaeolus cyanescens]|uniref:Ecp2 effector protein-like domain-containing protein n=1 Tax=Panaeolus cyanescens TaxID=181874 RepID=A0A409YYA1_9AGAR|nr:hypothetical protein CVT24_002541 [Panaeolus cyanescens]
MVKLNSIALFFTSLVLLATAAPSSDVEARAMINNCGSSTFINQSSTASPLVKDCQQIVRNISGSGTWTTPLWRQRKLVSYGTCAFGVEGVMPLGITGFKVGNSDIVDLINDSIKLFQWKGKVGAKGEMRCQPEPAIGMPHIKVEWTIYHN